VVASGHHEQEPAYCKYVFIYTTLKEIKQNYIYKMFLICVIKGDQKFEAKGFCGTSFDVENLQIKAQQFFRFCSNYFCCLTVICGNNKIIISKFIFNDGMYICLHRRKENY
jgi:hypothetical protein